MDMIVNFTPTGMIPTKDMTSHVPISADEIIEDVHQVDRRSHRLDPRAQILLAVVQVEIIHPEEAGRPAQDALDGGGSFHSQPIRSVLTPTSSNHARLENPWASSVSM